MSNSITKHLIISGRVQGVSYRAWLSDLAYNMGVHGWVRNRSNGTVEAVVQGSSDKITAIIEAAHVGPTLANVTKVTANDTRYDGPATFEVRASS